MAKFGYNVNRVKFPKIGKGATNFGVIFSFLAITVTDTVFAF